jgi:hypothetical protein
MNINPEPNIEHNTNIENKNTYSLQFYGRKITFVIGSLNQDTNLQLETTLNNVFPEYTVANRSPSILKKLNKMIDQGTDILCIQEGRKCKDKGYSINSVDPIVNYLTSKNYVCEVKHYNDSGDKAFQYITAFNSDKFNVVKSERILLSENGKEFVPTAEMNDEFSQLSEEKKKQLNNLTRQHYFNQAHPRSIFITEATHKETAQQIFTINIHLGVFPESHKSKSIEFIIKQVNELQQQYPDSVIFLAGDFNSFADLEGIQQIKMLTDVGFKELSATIKHPDGNDFYGNSTFIAYPYDYASYNANDNIRSKVNTIKDEIKQAEADQLARSDADSKFKQIRDKMVAIFDYCCSHAEQSSTDENSALYPITGQLDHIFVTSKNKNIEITGEATVQIYDTEGDTIANSREAIIEHAKNSLKNNIPSVATDHQGIISKVSIYI